MSDTIIQVAVLVAMTHAIRALGRIAGPTRCGLILGLPSSSAVMLVFLGRERGVAEASGAAESCLLGLIAAVTLALVYARAAGAGWRLPWAPAAGVAGYLGMAAALRCLPPTGAAGCVAASALGVLAACRLSRGRPVAGGASRWSAVSKGRALALRTAVPAALVVLIRTIGSIGGAAWAGLFITFPGMSLAVLTATHLESGPSAACRLARAIPPGNLGMIAFLAAFRFALPRCGLAWGAAFAYATALATLVAIEGLARPARPSRSPAPARPRPRLAARFSPRIEPAFG